jgi:hypothetical protein
VNSRGVLSGADQSLVDKDFRGVGFSREIPDGSKNFFSNQVFPINNKLKSDVFTLIDR